MTNNRALVDLDALPCVCDHLVVPVTELITLGITEDTIVTRCEPGGPWQRMAPNLVLLTDTPPSRRLRIEAAMRVAGEDAVLTGVDALKLHGMTGARLLSAIHILVPARRQPGLVDGVYFERTHQLPEPLHLNGLAVAPLPRATVDTCRRTKHSGAVEDLLAETIYKGRITPATLRDELDRAPKQGTALPRRKLAELDDKVRSMAQGLARRLVRDAKLPPPEWRVPITTQNGAHIATADAWWDEVGLAWEVDSYAFDLSPADARAALNRAARLTASGVLVVHTTPAQLRDEPTAVADLLRTAYTRAASRPRPEVKPHARTRRPPSPGPRSLHTDLRSPGTTLRPPAPTSAAAPTPTAATRTSATQSPAPATQIPTTESPPPAPHTPAPGTRTPAEPIRSPATAPQPTAATAQPPTAPTRSPAEPTADPDQLRGSNPTESPDAPTDPGPAPDPEHPTAQTPDPDPGGTPPADPPEKPHLTPRPPAEGHGE